jgi:hypothetical protein
MPNNNRNKLNQTPTGQGKKQSPMPGDANKLNKRAEVLQATSREQNIGTADEEAAADGGANRAKPGKRKAGR